MKTFMTDIDNLKAHGEQVLAAMNRRDVEALLALWHDQIVLFSPDAPFAVDGKEGERQ